jgi:5'-3' exonuclease
MKKYNDYMTRIIISADKDFLQLKDVVQYDCWGKKIEISINGVDDEINRKDYLLWKIIRGDLSDNIKNVFPKYGDIKSWKLVKDRDLLKRMLTESNDSVERFKRNSQLIDFRHIPEDYTNKILEIVDNKLQEINKSDDFSLEDCLVF